MKKFDVKIKHLINEPKWVVSIESVDYIVDEVEIQSKMCTSGEYLTTKAKNFSLVSVKNIHKAVLK